MIKKREDVRKNHFNDPNAFIECPVTMGDVYEYIDDYNPNRKRKKLIVFDDMIGHYDKKKKKKIQPIVKELFVRCRKLNI